MEEEVSIESQTQSPQTFERGEAYTIRLVIGAFFVLLGLLLTLDNLGIAATHHLLRYWSLVLVVIGGLQIAAGRRILGVLQLAAGLWVLGWNVGWLRLSIFDLWPLILIGAGLSMVARASGFSIGAPQTSTPAESSVVAVLSSRSVAVTSRVFSAASVFAFMGSCKLDLTGAEMGEGRAVVDATAIWGGIVVLVPPDWEVLSEVVPVMGGFEMKAASSTAPRRQLLVRGTALMGGIEVKNARRTA
jgi:hypothetical protein